MKKHDLTPNKQQKPPTIWWKKVYYFWLFSAMSNMLIKYTPTDGQKKKTSESVQIFEYGMKVAWKILSLYIYAVASYSVCRCCPLFFLASFAHLLDHYSYSSNHLYFTYHQHCFDKLRAIYFFYSRPCTVHLPYRVWKHFDRRYAMYE